METNVISASDRKRIKGIASHIREAWGINHTQATQEAIRIVAEWNLTFSPEGIKAIANAGK